MKRQLDILDIDSSEPVMPSACGSGGCGCSEPALPPPPSFGDVRVNGVEIAPEAIAREIQHHPAPDAETAWIEAARALAVRELLMQEAIRLGFSPDTETDDEGWSEDEDEALIRLLLEREVAPECPGEAECLRYYEANAERFRTPDLFEAAHILIEPERQDDAAWNQAEAHARAIATQVGDDPAAFAEAARAHSGCASALQDGSLGQIRRGELVPVVQQAIERLTDGETGREPVRSRFGWHVLRLQRRIPGRAIPFEVMRDKIVDMLEARSWSIAATRYVAALAQQGSVEGVLIEGAGA